MSQKILLVLFFFVMPFAVGAQTANADREMIDAGTTYKKVLLIPYHPMMHLSDADQDIGEYSEVSGEKVRAAFRLGLTSDISDELTKIYPTYALPSNSTIDNELEIIYSSVNYRMDTVFPVSHPSKGDTLQKKSIFSKIRFSKPKDIHDLKYMNITLSHPDLLAGLAEKYGTDLFVFLNQFEIITHYDDCLDLALKIYRRQ